MSPFRAVGSGGNCDPAQSFEDFNLNGVLDPGEDLNGNGILDATVNEDVNGNGMLDPGEDLNNNNMLDTALPIYDLADGSGIDCERPFLASYLPTLTVADCDEIVLNYQRSCEACYGRTCAFTFGLDPTATAGCTALTLPYRSQCQFCVADAAAGNFDYTNCLDFTINGVPTSLPLGEFVCRNGGDGFGPVANNRQCGISCDSSVVFGNCDVSEDANGNGVLDPAEDVNNNGMLDPGEDIDGDGFLDPAEDVNNNGVLDDPSLNALISPSAP